MSLERTRTGTSGACGVGSEKVGTTAEETAKKTGTKSFVNMIIVTGCSDRLRCVWKVGGGGEES